jgi:site-specific DNA recombinase
MRDLRAGKYETLRRCDEHVRRVLRIGYLAPDIIEAIIEGRQPRSMTVKRLLQRVPCDWADQRAAFDFARS